MSPPLPRRRRSLSALPLLIALALAAPAIGAQQARVPASRASPVQIHPLLIGRLTDPDSPLWGRISRHAAVLTDAAQRRGFTLTPESVGAYLERAAEQTPVDAMAAGALARLAVEPQPAEYILQAHGEQGRAAAVRNLLAGMTSADPTDLSRALGALAQSSRYQAVFDGAAPSLELDGLVSTDDGLALSGGRLELIGRGEFGVVYGHPRVPGAVIKAFSPTFEVFLFAQANPRRTTDEEEASARALAKAGVGPRYLGRSAISGRPVSVRERVFGDDLGALILERKFGRAEYDLVLRLLRRMAAARLSVKDMRPPNVMIGHTLLDPRRRALIVDGGDVAGLDSSSDSRGRFKSLLDQDTVVRMRWDPNVGPIVSYKPFRQILDEGLKRSLEKTRWERFKGFLRDLLENSTMPPPR